jgi:lysozyme
MGFWSWIKPRTGGPDVPGAAPQDAPQPRAPTPAPGAPTATPGAGQGWWTGGVPPECHEMSTAFEAFRSAPYRDSGGVWTIGIGSTRDARGRAVTASTPPVTRGEAEDMARRDLAHAEMLVRQAFPDGLPARWAAVAILLANNLGSLRIKAPTLVRLLQAARWRAAADQLKEYRNANGRPEKGLRRRRWAEAAYALGMPMEDAHARAWAQIHSADDWPALPS